MVHKSIERGLWPRFCLWQCLYAIACYIAGCRSIVFTLDKNYCDLLSIVPQVYRMATYVSNMHMARMREKVGQLEARNIVIFISKFQIFRWNTITNLLGWKIKISS